MTAGPLGASTVQRRRWVCSVCSAYHEPGARFCDHCGTPLPNSIGSICPNCRTLNLFGDPFCEQCGTALTHSPYLIITDSGQHVNLFHDDENSIVIGRSDSLSGVAPDIDLNPFGAEAAAVSRRHVRLTRRDNQIWLEDLNSINLTYINNQRLRPDRPQLLNEGDLLHFGRLLVTFRA